MKPQLLKCIGVIINQVVRVGAGELKKKKKDQAWQQRQRSLFTAWLLLRGDTLGWVPGKP